MKEIFKQHQRFSLRKYSFGLASVLLGVGLLATGQTAQADEEAAPVLPEGPDVTTTTTGDPGSMVTETSTQAVGSEVALPQPHVASSEATMTLDLTSRVSEIAQPADETVNHVSATETASSVASNELNSQDVPQLASSEGTSGLRSASRLTNPSNPSSSAVSIHLADAKDADDPMPGDDQLTDTSQYSRANNPELANFVPTISTSALDGNSLTPVTFTGDQAAFNINDTSKRVAAIWSVRDAAGTEDAYFVSFVYDLPSQTYEMRVYDSAKNLISIDSVPRQNGARKKLQLAGDPSADLAYQSFVALSYENSGYDAIYNGTDGNTAQGRPADKSGVKRIYSALINSQVGTDYRPLGSAITYQSTGNGLPTAVTMTVNYLEEGTNRQLRPSDQFTGLAGDSFTTAAASERDFDTDLQNKGYELDTSKLPKNTSGNIEGNFWGGKGFVYVRDLTRNGHTLRYRSTVINDDGDIVMEGWDKATGKKIPIRGYKTVYMDAGNGAYVVDRVSGGNLTEYEYVSQPIKPAAYPDSSSAQWGAVAFHVTNGFDHLFTNSWKPSVSDITYWYSRPKGDVTVEYYIEGTNTKIAADQKAADQVSVKESYDASTADLRPATISYNGDTYRLVESNGSPVLRQGSAPVTGTVEKNTLSVQYLYRKVEKVGSVAVTYQAEDGTVLKARELVVDGQPEGTAYTTTALSFPNYTLVGNLRDSAPTSGTVTGDTTLEVVYTYARQKGSVDVTYRTEDGTILEGPTVVANNVEAGTSYSTSAKNFSGYSFKEMSSNSAAASGTVVGDSTLHVVYIYSEDPVVKYGSVDVTYQTEDGTILEGPTVVANNVEAGTSYSTSAKNFSGYSFKEMSSNSAAASGTVVGDSTLHVVYVYSESPVVTYGSVDVTYQTEDGTILEGPTVVANNVEAGTSYSTSAKNFSGYSFKEMSSNSAAASGTVVGDSTLHVVYVYSLVSQPDPAPARGNVKVEYRDEDGNEIAPPRMDVTDAIVGTSYNTNEAGENPSYIDKEDVRYRLVGQKGKETGQVTQGTTTVTYIYRALGEVVVEYVDEFGNRLSNPRVVEPWQEPGMEYDTTVGNPRYIYRNGAKYEIERVEGHEKGKIGKGRTTVTYVYRLVEEPERYNRPKNESDKQKTEVKRSRKTVKATTYHPDSPNNKQGAKADSVTSSANKSENHPDGSEEVSLPETGESKNPLARLGVVILGFVLMIFGLSTPKKEK